MADIFVSYRREDSGGHAGRLVDDLREHFQNASIFHDIQSIHAGTSYVQAIGQAIAASRVMLVVIGPDWLDPAPGRRHSRIHDSDDPVHCEIAWAFYHRRVVIPVLVGNAKMVTPEQLPADIRFLQQLHAHEQSVTRWDYDLAQLAGKITNVTGLARRESGAPVSVSARRRPQSRSWLTAILWMVGGGLLVTLCSVMLYPSSHADTSAGSTTTSTAAAPPTPAPAPSPPVTPVAPTPVTPTPVTPTPVTDVTAPPTLPPGNAELAPPDINGIWYESDRANPIRFEQVGTMVSVALQLVAQQAVVAGQGQWLSGRLVLNVTAYSVTDGTPGKNGVLTITPSPDARILNGTFQLDGASAREITLQR